MQNDQPMRWHILIASPGQEIKADDGLHARKVESFVPKLARAQRAGRSSIRVVPRPMLQCYAFANLPVDVSGKVDGGIGDIVRATPGIQGFMMLEYNRYATVPNEAIDMLRFTEAEIEEDRCRKFNRPPAFAVGQRVSIPKGPWSEIAGKIKSLHGNMAEVVMEMAILGRDTARVDVSNLRQAG